MINFKTKILSFAILFCISVECRANKIPQFVPQGYHLDLNPDLDVGKLKGLVIINIATYAEPTNIIELDADPSVSIQYKSIQVIESAKGLRNADNNTKYEITAVERVLYNPGTLRIHLNAKLLRDITYQVHIGFETVLKNTDENEPFYMKTCTDKTQTKRKLFIMDLTKEGCYKAFPCFNEPAYKSWIALSVVRKKNFYAFSSTPINYTISLTPDRALVKDYFLNTPPLSMNSLALVVTEIIIPKLEPSSTEIYESSNEADITTLYDIPNYVTNLETVNTVIKNLEEHLLIPFPSKTFNYLVYPREANIPPINAYGLLVLTEPYSEELYISELVIGIFRQWFNHMATPVSKNSIIEAILTAFRFQMTPKILEKLNITRKNEFKEGITGFMQFILFNDLVEIKNSSNTIKDGIFVNMMDNLYESKLLNEAVHMLLRKKEFKMYSDEDVWYALNEASTRLNREFERTNYENLNEVRESWHQPGFFPLVTVQRDYQNNEINITQEPFIFGNDEFQLLEAQQNVSYYRPRMIPVIISHPNNYFTKKEFLGWMSSENRSFHMKFTDRYDFIVFNPAYIGFFVTNYDERNWMMLMENFESLPSQYKLQLLFDSMVLAKMDKLNYTYFLNMSLSINHAEHDLQLWKNYRYIAGSLKGQFYGEVGRKFQEYIYRQALTLLSNIQSLDFNSYPKNEQEFIENTKKMIKFDLNCLRNRASCFTVWEYEILMYEVRTGKSLSGERNCAIIRNVSLPDWEIIANALFHALQNNATYDKYEVLQILSCTGNPLAFETLLNLVFLNFNGNGFLIDEDDQKSVLHHISDSENSEVLLRFVDKNFYMLKERLNDNVWKYLIRVLVLNTKTENDSKELFNLYNKYSGQFGVADIIIREGLVIVSKKVRRNSEIFPVIENWLDFALNEFRTFAGK